MTWPWEVVERDHEIQNPARSRAAAAGLEALIETRALHERRRRVHFAYRRALLGWAIFVGRKP
jgi:hypothetical protein